MVLIAEADNLHPEYECVNFTLVTFDELKLGKEANPTLPESTEVKLNAGNDGNALHPTNILLNDAPPIVVTAAVLNSGTD